jgi:hypothetical protein
MTKQQTMKKQETYLPSQSCSFAVLSSTVLIFAGQVSAAEVTKKLTHKKK